MQAVFISILGSTSILTFVIKENRIFTMRKWSYFIIILLASSCTFNPESEALLVPEGFASVELVNILNDDRELVPFMIQEVCSGIQDSCVFSQDTTSKDSVYLSATAVFLATDSSSTVDYELRLTFTKGFLRDEPLLSQSLSGTYSLDTPLGWWEGFFLTNDWTSQGRSASLSFAQSAGIANATFSASGLGGSLNINRVRREESPAGLEIAILEGEFFATLIDDQVTTSDPGWALNNGFFSAIFPLE
ncbi:MAG: hypothetical protein AAFY71_15630 [Bacteroidota bacterium]